MDANCALGVESSLASGLRRKSLLSRVQRPRPALQRPKMLPRGSSQEYASTIGHHSHDKGLSAFNRFTRPHTILGTTVRLVQSTSLASVSPWVDHRVLIDFRGGGLVEFDACFECTRTGLCNFHGTRSAEYIIVCKALVPALLMNIAIVGLNQVYDKRIDMVKQCNLQCLSSLPWSELRWINHIYH